MCGLIGWIKKPKEVELDIEAGLIKCASRGIDATGIAYHDGTKIVVDKNGVDAGLFTENLIYNKETPFLLGHTRATTRGTEKKNVNNHPHYNNRYVIIHNGTIHSTANIKTYPYKSECDSENFVAYLSEYGWEGLKKIQGAGAVVGYDIFEKQIFLFRESNPLVLGLWNGCIIFGSTKEIASQMLPKKYCVFTEQVESWWEVPEGEVFIFKNNKFESVYDFEFKTFYTGKTYTKFDNARNGVWYANATSIY